MKSKYKTLLGYAFFIIFTGTNSFATNIQVTDPAYIEDPSTLECSHCHVEGHGGRMDMSGLLRKNDANYKNFLTPQKTDKGQDDLNQDRPQKCPRSEDFFERREK